MVIVGAGHAGVQAAARLAELGWDGGIVLADQEDPAPYERPPLSKDLLKAGHPGTASRLRQESFYPDKKIDRIAGTPVTRIRRATREVELWDGARVRYGKLVLATGATAHRLTVPGADLPGVHTLKTWADARAVKAALAPGRRVVVVGAGYIGLEVAAAASELGCAVTVLEFQDRVMSRVTAEPVSRHFEALHRAHGVRFVFGAQVSEFRGTGGVQRVVTADGGAYEADAVVVGVGVVPNQRLAEEAGIVCSDGIVVDEHCRTSDPDVYAIGDVSRLVAGSVNRRLESVQNAVAQAITAANHVASGAGTRPEVPWFWTIQHGVRLQTAGLREPGDDVVVRGSAEDGRFSVLYLREGRLAAIDTVGSLRDFVPAKKLIAAGARLDRSRAADPSVKLTQAQDLVTAHR